MKAITAPPLTDLMNASVAEGSPLLHESLSEMGRASALPQLKYPISDPQILVEEQQFLERWQHTFALTPERIDYMRAWFRSLRVGFGTPANEYFESLAFEKVEQTLGLSPSPVYQVSFTDRFEWMSHLRRNDLPAEVPDELQGTIRLDKRCGCCHSSMQAEAHALDSEKFPILMGRPGERIQMMPNRFAWDIGGVLIQPIDHDNMVDRVQDLFLSSTGENSKITRGCLITDSYLTALFQSSSDFDLVIFQNHPLSGMSQPFHIHAHGVPAEFPKGQIIKSLASMAERPTGDVALATSPLHRNDVLLISSADLSHTIRYATQVLRGLELNHQVYTFACYDKCIAIAPEHYSPGQPPHERGARPLLNWLRPQELNRGAIAISHLYPASGEFNWQPYLPIETLPARVAH